jgi:hypothetical protein
MSDELLPEADGPEEDVPTPVVLYLGWRLVQGIVWLVQQIT